MQGLASPFHLPPASQMGYTKNPEVNYVPFLIEPGCKKLKPGLPMSLSLSFFFSLLLDLGLSQYGGQLPHALLPPCFFLTSPLLDYCITNDYKTFDFKQPPFHLPPFHQLCLGYRHLYLGPGSSGMPRPSLRPPLCKWFVCVIFGGYPWMQCRVAETIH